LISCTVWYQFFEINAIVESKDEQWKNAGIIENVMGLINASLGIFIAFIRVSEPYVKR
jgi:hypothetical protein